MRLLLGGQADLTIVAEAASGQEAVDLHTADPVDLLLMDLRMPVLDGIAATRMLKALPEPPAILVLTTFDADDYVVRALAVGADGFLLKDTDPPEIVAAIRGCWPGGRALSPSVTAALIKQVVDGSGGDRSAAARRAAELLTDRECEVAVCLARGQFERGDRRGAVHERGHRQGTHLTHLRQARRHQPGASGHRHARCRAGLRTQCCSARTSATSRHLRRSSASNPERSVSADAGHPRHAPARSTVTTPSSTPISAIRPPWERA